MDFFDFIVNGVSKSFIAGTEGAIQELVSGTLGKIESTMKSINPNFKIGAEHFSLFGAIGYWDDVYAKIGNINTSLGVSGQLGSDMKEEFKEAFIALADMGIESEAIAKNLETFLNNTGRAMIVATEEMVSMSQLAAVFGTESIDILNSYRNLGYTIKTSTDRMKLLVKESDKYGVLPSKAVKNIKDNLSAVDKYYFKGGTKAFEQMAIQAARLNADMQSSFSLIDKILDGGIEGAVEMAQEMQLMGGPIAQMGDVFGLMQKAMSGDVEGLTKDLATAAAKMSSIGENGEIIFDTASMMQFRKLAQSTGVDIERMTKMGRAMAREMDVSKQLDLSLKSTPEKFDAMVAKVAGAVKGKDVFGNWLVTIDGVEKKVQDLTAEEIETKLSLTADGVSTEDTFKEIVRSNMDLSEVMNTLVAELKKNALGGVPYNEILDLARKTADTGAETLKSFTDTFRQLSSEAYQNMLGVARPLAEGDLSGAFKAGSENLKDAASDFFNMGKNALNEGSKILGNVLTNAGKFLWQSIAYGFEVGGVAIKKAMYEVWNNTFGGTVFGAKVSKERIDALKPKPFSEFMKDAEFKGLFEGVDFGEIFEPLMDNINKKYEALPGLTLEDSNKLREKIPDKGINAPLDVGGKSYLEVGGKIMLVTPTGQEVQLTQEQIQQLVEQLLKGEKNTTTSGN